MVYKNSPFAHHRSADAQTDLPFLPHDAPRMTDRVDGHRTAAPQPAAVPELTLRRVATEAEYEACVDLQHEIWGADYTGTVPTVILPIAQRVGGVVAGAFDNRGRLIGFVFGLTGVIDGKLAHWSDILAVRPEARDQGIGRRLKHYQRDLLRAIGVGTMYWTYDPLVARNAFLNLMRLGARPTEYVVDFYGDSTGSTLHGELGTDPLIVAWSLVDDTHAQPKAAGPVSADVASGPPIVNPRMPAAPRSASSCRPVPRFASRFPSTSTT